MHVSVLLDESIKGLDIKEDGNYVDCTLGYAGHSSEILKRVKKGFLFAFDKDNDAINYSQKKLLSISNNFEIIKSDFSNLKDELAKRDITKIDGFLFDLGVSSPQLDNADRGFSYQQDAELDMRMDKESKLSAKEVVNDYSEEALIKIFYEYGDEKYSRSIAKNIVKYRETKQIETTLELVDIIRNSVPFKVRKEKHPAKSVFQAIRIEVNGEIESLKNGLRDAIDMLNKDGRICVISFHSLEDRVVKNIFKEYVNVREEFRDLPIIPEEYKPKYRNVGKIKPSIDEIKNNKRSRSAVLRIIERI